MKKGEVNVLGNPKTQPRGGRAGRGGAPSRAAPGAGSVVAPPGAPAGGLPASPASLSDPSIAAFVRQRKDAAARTVRENRARQAARAEAMTDAKIRRAFAREQAQAERDIADFWRRFFRKAAPSCDGIDRHAGRRHGRGAGRGAGRGGSAPGPRPRRGPSPPVSGAGQLAAYSGPVLDRQGRRGVHLSARYLSGRTAGLGCARRLARYVTAPGHVEHDANGMALTGSNVGATRTEVSAAFGLLEELNRAARANAKVVHHFIMQLPFDVTPEARAQIMRDWCEDRFGVHDLPYVWSVHTPDADGDQRNCHGHVAASFRPLVRVAPFTWDAAREVRTEFDNPVAFGIMRARFAETMTQVCRDAGHDRVYTALSYAARGMTIKPTEKLGPHKTRLVRSGAYVAANARNAERIRRNAAMLGVQRLDRRQATLERRLARVRAAEARTIAVPAVRAPATGRPRTTPTSVVVRKRSKSGVAATPPAVTVRPAVAARPVPTRPVMVRSRHGLSVPAATPVAPVLLRDEPVASARTAVTPVAARTAATPASRPALAAPLVLADRAKRPEQSAVTAVVSVRPSSVRTSDVPVITPAVITPAVIDRSTPAPPAIVPVVTVLANRADLPKPTAIFTPSIRRPLETTRLSDAVVSAPLLRTPAAPSRRTAIVLSQPAVRQAPAPAPAPVDMGLLDRLVGAGAIRRRVDLAAARAQRAARRRLAAIGRIDWSVEAPGDVGAFDAVAGFGDIPALSDIPALGNIALGDAPAREGDIAAPDSATPAPGFAMPGLPDPAPPSPVTAALALVARVDAYVFDDGTGRLLLDPRAATKLGLTDAVLDMPETQAGLAAIRTEQQRVFAALVAAAGQRPLAFRTIGSRPWPRDLEPGQLARLDRWSRDEGFGQDLFFAVTLPVKAAHDARTLLHAGPIDVAGKLPDTASRASETPPVRLPQPVDDGLGGRRETPAPVHRRVTGNDAVRVRAFDADGSAIPALLLLLRHAGEHPGSLALASDGRLTGATPLPPLVTPLIDQWRHDDHVHALVVATVRASREAGRPVWPLRHAAAIRAGMVQPGSAPPPASPHDRGRGR